MGYRFEAMDYSNRTHRLEVPPKAMGQTNFYRVYKDILEFITADEGTIKTKRPIVYTTLDNIEMLKSVMAQLSNQEHEETLDIFPTLNLFCEIKNESGHHEYTENKNTIQNLGRLVFENVSFEYHLNIGCEV